MKRVELLPVTVTEYRNHWESNVEPLESKLYTTATDLVKSSIESFVCDDNSLNNEIRSRLKASKEYKQWRKMMPPLKNVLSIKEYRLSKGKFKMSDVESEILEHGLYLPEGQLLFHGGDLRGDEVRLQPISTSLRPSVAIVHATQDESKKVTMLKVDDQLIKAFAFSIAPNQINSKEFEILIQSNIHFELCSETVVGEFTMLQMNITHSGSKS